MLVDKENRIALDAMRESADEKPCTLYLGGCWGDTVLCHLRGDWALGLGIKPHDFHAVYACQGCHRRLDMVDGAEPPHATDVLRALIRTQNVMIKEGLLRAGKQP